MAPVSRREFLGYTAALPFLLQFHELAAAQRKRVKIRDVQVMMLEGGRTYTLVKITADDGLFGIAEAYGSPGVGVKEQILSLKPWLVGKDPLEIDTLYMTMGAGTRNLSGTRTDGSAHNLIRAVSGIEMALWDLAGKILDVPTRRCSAASSAIACASTIMPRRRTCWTRARAKSGRRASRHIRAASPATSSDSRTRT